MPKYISFSPVHQCASNEDSQGRAGQSMPGRKTPFSDAPPGHTENMCECFFPQSHLAFFLSLCHALWMLLWLFSLECLLRTVWVCYLFCCPGYWEKKAAGTPVMSPGPGVGHFSLPQCATDSNSPRKQNNSRVWISGKWEYLERAFSGCGSEALNQEELAPRVRMSREAAAFSWGWISSEEGWTS